MTFLELHSEFPSKVLREKVLDKQPNIPPTVIQSPASISISVQICTMVEANSTTKEVIHDTTSQSSLQICLVNTATGVPFINVLELRLLNRDAYTTPSGSIKMLFPSYHGNPESAMIR
ncbi:unnamed protein product [Brassica napus]|uniref:(rape) hypothetical protein n=1 Tax=Brassica napus TaxID=3708 RepID=A0A816NR55_BRANA|nr:unnamed protein product [Brassica napus]